MATLNKAEKELLVVIIAAGENGTYANYAKLKKLEKEELVEVNQQVTNEKGEVACRATEKGKNEMATATEETVKEKVEFEIETVAIPESKRGGFKATGSKYPFDKLEVGQSFFVPATEAKPDPVKAMASTASAAAAKFAVKVFEEDGTTPKMRTNKKGNSVQVLEHTRKFVIRADEKNGVKGARIARVK